jgi:hypothetical protein
MAAMRLESAMRAIAILSVLVVTVATASADPKCDLSTDAGVDAAYKAATGHEMSTYGGRCAQRSSTFPAMYVLGTFLSDRGCRWEGRLHGCIWNDPNAAHAEMAAAGWAKADAKKRKELALAWLREVDVISVESESVTTTGDKLVVDFWVTEPAGMNPKPPSRTHEKVVFAADGTHGSVTAF